MEKKEGRIIAKLVDALPKMTDFQKGKILGACEALEEVDHEKDKIVETSDEDLQPAI